MSAGRCARCGRELPEWEPGSDSSGRTDLRLAPAAHAWAEIGGQDVCPECQTPDESRGVTRRLVAFIEREVDRRQAEGVPPDMHESSLIGYALQLRLASENADQASEESPGEDSLAGSEQLASTTSNATTAGASNSETQGAPNGDLGGSTDSGGRSFEVAVTGAFLTGYPLAVQVRDYATLQTKLAKRWAGLEWTTANLSSTEGSYESAGGGGFTQSIPVVLARRYGVDFLPWLSAALAESRAPNVIRQHRLPAVFDATPVQLVVDFYDLGVAVLTATFSLPKGLTQQRERAADAVKRLVWLRPDDGGRSPVAEALQKIAVTVTKEYGEAVSAVAPTELRAGKARLGVGPDVAGQVDLLIDEYGRLLWLHPVFILRLTDTVAATSEPAAAPTSDAREGGAVRTVTSRRASCEDPRRQALQELAPAFHKSIKIEKGVFAPGIGASAVVVDGDSGAEAAPLRLTTLHWAYYALHIGIDRNLLGVLGYEGWSSRERRPLGQLEAEADMVFNDYRRISEARARLDSHLGALGGDELEIWDTIAKVQRFDMVLAGVDAKLATIRELASRRVALATADRARRLGDIVGALTVLTVVTAAIAVLGTFWGTGDNSLEDWTRIGVVTVAGVTAIVIYWLAFIRTARTPAAYRDRA